MTIIDFTHPELAGNFTKEIMSMKKKFALYLYAGVLSVGLGSAYAQETEHVLIHSHNDYLQRVPFYQAYAQQAYLIEADVFALEDEESLLVGHNRKELRPDRVLETMYIRPIVDVFKANGGRAWRDSEKRFMLLIDLKTSTETTLPAVVNLISKYREVFDEALNPYAVTVVISGDMPHPSGFDDFPQFIWFDGRLTTDYSVDQLKRIALVSAPFSNYSKWNGEGELSREDGKRLVKAIKNAHDWGKKIRFWGAPDVATAWNTLHRMGVDIINTDQIERCAEYFFNYHKLRPGGKSCSKFGEESRIELESFELGKPLPPWREGLLDLHHISTGRGDAAFYILPDGTTMLVDAGEDSEDNPRTFSERNTPRYPSTEKFAYAWIVDYIKQFGPAGGNTKIDCAILTHFHSDHFGAKNTYSPYSQTGDYQLVGIVGVGEQIKIKKMVDRGYPDYDYTTMLFGAHARSDSFYVKTIPTESIRNYWQFIAHEQKNSGMVVERFIPGKLNQFGLKKTESYPTFKIRNIVGNGLIWAGYEEETIDLNITDENNLSLGFRLSYGNFDYFTGGDISGVGSLGNEIWNSVEANVAPVVGPVDVATLNHHGNRDSQTAYYVRTIRPRVWIQQAWSSDHPGEEVLRRITSRELYPGARDVFTTSMLEANKLVIGDMVDDSYGSQQGHILVRVAEGGATYYVIILNHLDEERNVKAVFGPYSSR